jgi:hypothetical protein
VQVELGEQSCDGGAHGGFVEAEVLGLGTHGVQHHQRRAAATGEVAQPALPLVASNGRLEEVADESELFLVVDSMAGGRLTWWPGGDLTGPPRGQRRAARCSAAAIRPRM